VLKDSDLETISNMALFLFILFFLLHTNYVNSQHGSDRGADFTSYITVSRF
jgi:hypothetical protein